MDHIEDAKIALGEARQELWEAEWSGDHEAVLIWRRTVADLTLEVADVMFSSSY